MGSRGERGVAGAKEQIFAFLYIIIMRLYQFMMEGVGPRLNMLVHSQLVKPQISIIIEKGGASHDCSGDGRRKKRAPVGRATRLHREQAGDSEYRACVVHAYYSRPGDLTRSVRRGRPPSLLDLRPDALPSDTTLNDVVSAYLRRNGRRERLYRCVRQIVDAAPFRLSTGTAPAR
jgi:hypothetical protein